MAFSVLCFILLLWSSPAFVASLNEEGLALLSFKGSLKEYPESYFTSWNSSDETPCSWLGVTCKAQRVSLLSIPNRKLSGTLPSSLGKLSAIRHLNLRGNNLSGILPSDLFNATGLRSLILSGNSLSGPLPPQIEKLNYLLFLDLSHNSFNGSIPPSIVQCKRLKILRLDTNFFSGPFPTGLGTNLTTLENLNLSANRLTGSIPGDFGNLTTLKGTLDMSHNLFTGHIPESLGKLPVSVYINLSYNNLSGPIPKESTLLSAGPTAFLGNPSLCGPPLKQPCSDNMNPQLLIHPPFLNPGGKPDKSKKHSHLVIIIMVTGIFLGICFFGLLFSYTYKKVYASKRGKAIGGCNFQERSIMMADIFCFAKDGLETSQNLEQYNFVRLDQQIDFTLDQLLTASAFLLGKSGLGILYKVVLENGLTLAVRRLGGGGSQRFKDYQTEVEAIGKIKHPNIVALRAYCWSVEEKLLIYDYVPNGDLATALHGKAGMVFFTPISWPVRLRIIKGIAKGLTHLHEDSPKKYVHGNLKPSNILLGQNMEPKISDLGLCRLANPSGESPMFQYEQTTSETPPQNYLPYELAMTATSSPAVVQASHYKAPEASSVRKPTQKWDVYSFGVIVLEMISGKLPLIQVGSVEMDIVQWFHLSIEESKPLLDVLDPSLANDLDMQDEIIGVLKVALACVHRSPEKRPSMRHVCDMLARLA